MDDENRGVFWGIFAIPEKRHIYLVHAWFQSHREKCTASDVRVHTEEIRVKVRVAILQFLPSDLKIVSARRNLARAVGTTE